MKDPKRIDRILGLIRTIWKRNPDLRLCQLMGNTIEPGDDYYREDDVLEAQLREYYDEQT